MPIDKHWEDHFDEYAFYDYKTAHVERERLRQENSYIGWIYVGVCVERPDRAKIGLTTGELGTRASSPQNPSFALLCAFKVKEGTEPRIFKEIEGAAKDMLGKRYKRINHISSGLPSEWFYADPLEFRTVVHDFLYEMFDRYMDCYWCSDREFGVIRSWQNDRLLNGGHVVPYQANDLSNPPVAFECTMPPGCGEDCNCW